MVLRHRISKIGLLMLIYSVPMLLLALVASWARW